MQSDLEAAISIERFVRGERFDAIICDLMMPNTSGMDFHARLSALVPQQAERVIFLSGGAFTDDAQAFLRDVTNLRLDKPVSAKDLRDAIADVQRGRGGLD